MSRIACVLSIEVSFSQPSGRGDIPAGSVQNPAAVVRFLGLSNSLSTYRDVHDGTSLCEQKRKRILQCESEYRNLCWKG